MKRKIIIWVTGILVAIMLLGLAGMTFYKYAPISEVKTINESVE
ncbi:hypothetical protein [Peribacillus sp. NPDC096448]